MPSLLNARDDLKDLLDNPGCEAERRLVQQQHRGPAHQRPRDRQHLLLAARQAARGLGGSLAKNGKESEQALHVPLDVLPAGAQESAEPQIVPDAHFLEQLALFGDQGDARLQGAIRRGIRERRTVQFDRAGAARQQADYRLEKRRLAGAVGAEQGHDLAARHVQADAVQHAFFSVPAMQVTYRKHGLLFLRDRP